ncbi:hypothetical protein SESBI_35926 [Sesbania bispinosa]|nr:hypothetical protein SESBI_35926 [Sesbania bispinosa]
MGREKGTTFKRGLKQLCNDDDAIELTIIAEKKQCEIEIYLEHGMSRESNLQFVQVPLISNKPVEENVQVNEVQNDVNQTEVEVNKVQENVTHTEVEVNEVQDNVTYTEVEVEVNETYDNGNQTKVPVSVPNSKMGNKAMNDNEAEIHENCETEAVVDSDSSENSMRDVHFEDDEEERAIGADDGFRMAGMGHNEAEIDSDTRAEDNACDASGVDDKAGDNTHRSSFNVGDARGTTNVGNFVPPDVANTHNIDKEYESDVENIDGDMMRQKQSMKDTTQQPDAVDANNWGIIAEVVHTHQHMEMRVRNLELSSHNRTHNQLQIVHNRVQAHKINLLFYSPNKDHNRIRVSQNKSHLANNPNKPNRPNKTRTMPKGKGSNQWVHNSHRIPKQELQYLHRSPKNLKIPLAKLMKHQEQHRSNLRATNSAQGASSSAAPDPQNSPLAAASLNLHPLAGQPSTSMQSGPQQDQNKEGGDAMNDVGGSSSGSVPTKDKEGKAI